MGAGCLCHHLHVSMVNVRDFEAACGHIGLRGAIKDISREEAAGGVRARSAGQSRRPACCRRRWTSAFRATGQTRGSPSSQGASPGQRPPMPRRGRAARPDRF